MKTPNKVDRALRARCYSTAALRRKILASPAERPIHLERLFSSTLIAVSLSILCVTGVAQNVERIEKREVVRRQTALPQGAAAVARGQAAMAEKNYVVAHEEFRAAVNLAPDAVVSEKVHNEAVEGFCESGLKLAEQKIAEGKYEEAEGTLRELLSERYNPECKKAAELYSHLQQPGYFNRTLGPKFIAKVEEVKSLLTEADGYYNSGRYDLAFKKYEQVLALDPYNTAARRGEEKIDNTKYKYNEEAYNETRARQLWQVEKAWEQPVRKYGQTVSRTVEGYNRDVTGTARITNKLNTIIIPRVVFRDASIREAIDFLRQQAVANDPTTEGRKGVDIVLRLNPLGQAAAVVSVESGQSLPLPGGASEEGSPGPTSGAPPEQVPGATAVPVPARLISPAAAGSQPCSPADARVTLDLNQVPLGEVLRYIANQACLKIKIDPYAVSVVPITEPSNDLITKRYTVSAGFISTAVHPLSKRQSDPLAPASRPVESAGKAPKGEEKEIIPQLVNREDAQTFLQSQGVSFPIIELPGGGRDKASAIFLPQSNKLIVRNTRDNLDLVDALVDEDLAVSTPKQVEIEAKFIEITQNNLKELGFDWLLGQFNIGNHKVFGGGGTSGTGAAVNTSDFPFAPPGGPPVGQFPVTAGNRSGNLAISANAIDALLFPTTGVSSLAPGIFGLSGVFTDPQFQVVIRALNQKKGVDLLSAPKITTKSGHRAVIEIVREFRYPGDFSEPKVPDISGRGTSNSTSTTIALPVVGPSTPKDWQTRNTGVTLEVEPVVGPDNFTIDLNLIPQVVEFEGFINYGSPIKTVNPALLGFLGLPTALPGTTQAITLTDNVINQPIFSTRQVTTSVTIWDGQTVVLGGLMREDVQKVEDRTPIIGDIPLVGRLFRSNVDQHIKRNLMIFVTARQVNPAGQPLQVTEEEEEKEGVIEPPLLPQEPFYKK
jgi:general secretion pathway protein D